MRDILTEADLFTTDDAVWDKLTGANNEMINAYIRRLQPRREFVYASKEKAEFYGRNKTRYIDPLVLQDGKLQKTSELIVGLTQYIEELKQKCQYIGVIQKETYV